MEEGLTPFRQDPRMQCRERCAPSEHKERAGRDPNLWRLGPRPVRTTMKEVVTMLNADAVEKAPRGERRCATA
jgi:hypothetical protein